MTGTDSHHHNDVKTKGERTNSSQRLTNNDRAKRSIKNKEKKRKEQKKKAIFKLSSFRFKLRAHECERLQPVYELSTHTHTRTHKRKYTHTHTHTCARYALKYSLFLVYKEMFD